jgi:hypothetical protein
MNILRFTVVLTGMMIILTGCDEKVFTGDVDCDECYSDKPVKADLMINLTVNNQYRQVPVTVYEGDIEDGHVVVSDTVDYSPYYVYVPVDRKYSVKAEYKKDNVIVYAIDGTKLKIKSVSDACDDGKCYIIENEELDATIRRGYP